MKKVKLSTAIAWILLSVATTVNVTLIIGYDMINSKQGEYQMMQAELSKIYEAMEVVDRYYVGDIDKDTAIEGAIEGYVDGIGDRWSYYLTNEEYQEYLQDASTTLVGIGVSVVYSSSEQAMLITSIYDNSPAKSVGIEKLDYIVAVDGQYISDIGYTQAVTLIKGEEGSTVELEILRNGINQTVTVSRESVAKVSVNMQMVDSDIAYIQITEFETDTANQFAKAINNAVMQGAEGFVFDLRNNPGGYLVQLVECLDILLPEGTVISTISKALDEEIYTSDSQALEMPMAVIVNSNSYSAAEFFAASIQDYGVGTIVGEKTTGKGYAQSPLELSDGSAIVLSINKYYTPNGNNLANIGVTPDIIVELTDEQLSNYYFLTPQTDPQIAKAVEQVSIELLK